MTQFFPFSPFSTRNVTAWLCLAVLKAGFFLNPYSAVASCVESRIAVAASAPLFERKITAAWQTTPPCNVVESGLMIGRSPTGLAPVGTPLYASAEVYQQEVVSTDPGTYWIAAYARDEEGAVIQSPPFPVHIVSPPTSSLGPGGSHGPPPSYSGTDADFLIPAGEPHFASIKSLSRQNSIEDTFNTLVLDFGFRQIVDTQRGLVLSGQLQPIQARAGTVAFDGGQISSALDFYDRIYIPPAFPRKGIYAVFCNYSAFPSISTGCSDMGFVNSLFLQYTNDAATSTHPQTGTTMTRQIDSSTVSLFIPALPTGKRLVSAKLRASFVAVGSAQSSSTIVLNGQPPESAVTFSCTSGSGAFAGLTECSGVATWDFTSAANSLAAQGGGQLTIQPQISSPFTGTIFIPDEGNPASGTTSEVSFSSLGIFLSVNYPWKHAREDGSLTLVFEAACTPTLQVTVTPESVLPQRAGIAGPTQATVETRVQGCPDQTPGSVVVTLQMDPDLPVAGSSDAGGHNPPHRGVRPKGSFDVPNGPSTTQCTATVDASGAGSCSVNYFASEVSGKETIVARATGFVDAEKKIAVGVRGLANLRDVSTNFFRFKGQLPQHPDNHWGSPNTLTIVQLVALDFFATFGATLGINDISLFQGGLFDIAGTWQTPHRGHRRGTSVDINRGACNGLTSDPFATCQESVPVLKRFIEERCFFHGRGRLADELQIHCELPQ